MRKIIAAAAALCLAISTMTSSLALYDDDFICTIRGGSSQIYSATLWLRFNTAR